MCQLITEKRFSTVILTRKQNYLQFVEQSNEFNFLYFTISNILVSVYRIGITDKCNIYIFNWILEFPQLKTYFIIIFQLMYLIEELDDQSNTDISVAPWIQLLKLLKTIHRKIYNLHNRKMQQYRKNAERKDLLLFDQYIGLCLS